MLCTWKGCTEGGKDRKKCIWNNKTSTQINSTLFPWQRGAVIWRLVSHGCVSLPHRPPLCLTDGSCDCNHPSYCQRQKRARKGKSHTPSRSRSLVSSKQATPLWAEPTRGAQAFSAGCMCVHVCMCVPMPVWSTERTCVGVHLRLSVSAHYTAWSVTGVCTGSGGHVWSCSWSKAPESCSLVAVQAGLISTCLCSVDRKNKKRGRQQRRREARTQGGRQIQAGIAQMKECIKRPEWNIWQWYITALISLFWWDNWMAKASFAFVFRCNGVRDLSLQTWKLS